MTTGGGGPPNNLDLLDRVIGCTSAVIGVLPPASTASDIYPISLYQPAIYEHKEPFIIIPIIVALFASWSVLRWPLAMIPLSTIALILSIAVYYFYEAFPVGHYIHPINWILSYCVFALAVALFAGLILALKRP